ncbi:hypothetical protein JST99_00025 [Candidatus Dependentiae bacterium]|nr:hypothetical protein [Candidatus Dependentiae bacterium]MCC7414613.1 hypothetical protein [Campylobacterota bacterium]
MLHHKCLLIGILLFYALSLHAEIRIVCTAALLGLQADLRQQEYIHSVNIIQKLGYEPYIIEACTIQGPTFLDKYSNHVFYATVNNPTLKNKGVNEGKTLLQGLQSFNFHEEDMVIKLTGRYYFCSDYIIRTIEKHPHVDAFFVLAEEGTQVFTGCFAMRYKHLLAMLKSFDYGNMELYMINIELETAQYIKSKSPHNKLRVLYMDKVDVQGKIFGLGNIDLKSEVLCSW